MKVITSFDPLPGERVLGVQPTMAPEVAAGWRRRLNFYTGRSLSDVALSTEQKARSGRLASRGQMVSPGVVSGLEAALDRTGEYVHLAAGFGVAASGEDVLVPASRPVRIRSLPVYAPPRVFLEGGGSGGSTPTETEPVGVLEARRLGSPLGELIDRGVDLPPVGVLVLQPVLVEMIGELDPDDPCEIDPQNDAFDDWQLAEGCRLVFYAWPGEWATLPLRDNRWRNRIAYTIFEIEKTYGANEFLPWEQVGVPVGLLGFDDAWTPLFLDRYSVVRQGGKGRRRTPPVAGFGNPQLWQARIQQLAEEVAEANLAGASPEELAGRFRYLAPAGILPKDAVSPRDRRDNFFPPSYHVEVLPVPLEQLDVVISSSASLAPFDTFTPDRVQVLVPAPQVWYEPDLLQTEVVAPEFQEAIDQYIDQRAELLQRRLDVKGKKSAIVQSISGEPAEFLDPDPEALEEDEEVGADPLDPAEDDFGTAPVGEGDQATLQVTPLEQLRARLMTTTPLKHETAVSLASLPEGFQFPEFIGDRLRYDNARNLLIIRGVLTDSQRDELLQAIDQADLASATAQEMATAVEALYRRSQRDDLSKLDELGLEEFIRFLERKAQRADDRIDLGFLRVQTDIYRIRQLMLGAEAASRLTTSPALAAIAKGESALATQESLSSFLQRLRESTARVSERAAADSEGADRDTTDQPSPQPGTATPPRTFNIAMPIFGTEPVVARPLEPFAPLIPQRETLFQQIQLETTGAVLGPTPVRVASPLEISQKDPIVGKPLDFRNVTVGDRLEEPSAAEAKNYAVAGKYEVLRDLAEMDLALDDLQVPGFYQYNEQGQLQTEEVVVNPNDATKLKRVPVELRHRFSEIVDQSLYQQILGDRHDIDPVNGDEGAFFAAGVRALDNTIATLRIVEGRIQGYKNAIRLCQNTLQELNQLLGQADHRLSVLEDALAEARHNLSVVRALRAEEVERVNDVNRRRDQIIDEYVPFLAFHRPRLTSLVSLAPVPVRPLNPDLAEMDQPPCSGRVVSIPDELEAMVGLLRDAPVKWFPSLAPLLDRLDRVDILTQAVLHAQASARAKYVASQPPAVKITQPASPLAGSIGQIILAQQQVVARQRVGIAQANLIAIADPSWQRVRHQAEDAVTLGDLIESRHNRSAITQAATHELNNITQALACLYTRFGEVPPVTRLEWAQRLSQYNTPVNLRNLASLPRWGELNFIFRSEVQSMVDWLYNRVSPRYPEATGLFSDLVRICILLASHAPVNQIISGRLPQPATVKAGDLVKVEVTNPRVHVGMHALIYDRAEVVARAVVADLSSGQAGLKIVQARDATVQLAMGAQVQFGEESVFGLNPLTQGHLAMNDGRGGASFSQ